MFIRDLFKFFIFDPLMFQSHVAAAVIGSSVVGAVGSSMAAGSAADAQTAAADQANQTQMAMFNKTQANLQPYMNAGNTALQNLQAGMANGTIGGKFTNADLNANLAPNYQFQLEQGKQALQNSQAAQNGVLSGAAMKDMQNYVQGTAAGAYQNAYNNWLSTQNLNYGQMANLASLGENAGATVGNAGVQTGQAIGQNLIGAGNAQAAGSIAQGNALANGLSGASGYLQMNQMLGGGNPFGGGGAGGGTSSAVVDPSSFSTPAFSMSSMWG